MRSNQLVIRCFAKQEEGLWVAVCVDFTLAAQASSFAEAKEKLEKQIYYYVKEALEDKEYGAQLINRSAPLSSWIEYYYIKFTSLINHKTNLIFNETMPMRPACGVQL